MSLKTNKWKKELKDQHVEYLNEAGITIGLSKMNEAKVIEVDGHIFKNLIGSEVLLPYQDWRKSAEIRAEDLANRLTLEEIAGLMLYTSHQTVSENSSKYEKLFGSNTYDGLSFTESNKKIYDLTDQQKKFLSDDMIRHILISTIDKKENGARWANNIQTFAEMSRLGIPVNICSDPRHGLKASAEYNLGSGSDTSIWPEQIGLAATFDPVIVKQFGEVVSKEYRALGITTALSPQIDLATDPRWSRFAGTFGESERLTTDMAQAYCDGAQTSANSFQKDGWGTNSINTMVKHWPGGGTGEGGRDAHYAYGKYAVYPGSNFQTHLKPFSEGAFNLKDGTKKASAVMPYYTISFDQDPKYDENVGNSYSKYMITDLLRNKYSYDSVVCTDWLITADAGIKENTFAGKSWGVEKLSVTERHFKLIEAGVDQFGGNNDIEPVLEAFAMYKNKYGENQALERFRQSARRILKNMFQVGLFDNPYVNLELTKREVGSNDNVGKGYDAQLKSVVLLKNKAKVLPITKTKVYIPNKVVKSKIDWFGNNHEGYEKYPISSERLAKYYTAVDTPEEADFAIVFMDSPISQGFSDQNGGEYIPISLQYGPYTATEARKKSIAPGAKSDRSYANREAICENSHELEIVKNLYEKMNTKPIICCLNMKKPTIVAEFEKYVDVLIGHFGASENVLLDIISGAFNPSGLLPFQMPSNMSTVENQKEDLAFDMEPYTDELGNSYDFAFGQNYEGIIHDERSEKYRNK